MSLSKIYPSSDSFEPENLLEHVESDSPVFGSIVKEKLTEQQVSKEKSSKTKTIKKEQKNQPEDSRDNESLPEIDASTQSPPAAPPEQAAVPPPPPPPQPPAGVPEEKVEQLVAQAREEGVREGLQQAEADYGGATRSFLLASQQLDSIRETILRNSVDEIQNMVLAVAEKIIRHSVKDQSETILLTVEESLHKAVKSDQFYVFVNPDDFAIVEEKSEELVSGLSGMANIVVKKDPNIEQGGCRIDSENCIVDATLVSQLDVIEKKIKES